MLQGKRKSKTRSSTEKRFVDFGISSLYSSAFVTEATFVVLSLWMFVWKMILSVAKQANTVSTWMESLGVLLVLWEGHYCSSNYLTHQRALLLSSKIWW